MWYDPLSTPSSVVRLKTSHLCYKMSHHCDAWSKHQNGTMQDRRIQVGSQAEYPGSWTKGYIIVVISPIILNIWRSKPLKCWENDNVLWIGPRILANIIKINNYDETKQTPCHHDAWPKHQNGCGKIIVLIALSCPTTKFHGPKNLEGLIYACIIPNWCIKCIIYLSHETC